MPVNVVFGLSVVFGNVVCTVVVLRHSFVFSMSSIQVSASFTNICGLTVGTLDLVDCALSATWVFLVFNVC